MVEQISGEDALKAVLTSTEVVIIDFFAVWCGPCKTVSPILDQLASEYAIQFADYVPPAPAVPAVPAVAEVPAPTADVSAPLPDDSAPPAPADAPAPPAPPPAKKVAFVKIDVDADTQLAANMGITAMPTFMIFVNSQLKKTIMGANVPVLKDTIANAVAGNL